MIDGQVSLEEVRGNQLNAEETLALGKATLKAAFLSPTISWREGHDMMAEAFALRRRSVELGRQEDQLN